MRVPIPVVILLVLAVVGSVWWTGTREMDFMTPPSEERLREIRIAVESSIPRAEDAISVPDVVPEPPPVVVVEPEINLGDLTLPPALDNYGTMAPEGAAHLIEVAGLLEEKGEFQRALLAWERVLDLTKPNAEQAALAISSIKRLRPTLPDWNATEATAIPITLNAGTGPKMAELLEPVLEEVARVLETASSGLVKADTRVAAGKTGPAGNAPVPVALWIAGPGEDAVSTEVLSFTVESPEALHAEVLRTVFRLVRVHLARGTAYTPPARLAEGEDPAEALATRITRLSWSEFATALNLEPKKED